MQDVACIAAFDHDAARSRPQAEALPRARRGARRGIAPDRRPESPESRRERRVSIFLPVVPSARDSNAQARPRSGSRRCKGGAGPILSWRGRSLVVML